MDLLPFGGQEEFRKFSDLFKLGSTKYIFYHNIQKLKDVRRVLSHLGSLLVKAKGHSVSHI